MSKKVNLAETELKIILGEKVPAFGYSDFKLDYSWGHCKVRLNQQSKIIGEEKEGSLSGVFSNIGKEYAVTYYPEGKIFEDGCAGYCALSSYSLEKIKPRLLRLVKKTESKNFAPEKRE